MTESDSSSGELPEDFGYADAMAELETILATLERSDVDVDQLTDNLERASLLISRCRDRILNAEMSVSKIVESIENDSR